VKTAGSDPEVARDDFSRATDFEIDALHACLAPGA
jgi:hypothetical protein